MYEGTLETVHGSGCSAVLRQGKDANLISKARHTVTVRRSQIVIDLDVVASLHRYPVFRIPA